MKALINATIYDFHNFSKNSYVLFDSQILDTGNMKDFMGADEVYDCSGCIVMPSLVNCHTHIYSEFSRGMDVPFNPKSFMDILKQLWWKLDSQLDLDSVYMSALAYGCELIQNGVTSIIDHHASGLNITGSLEVLKKAICDTLGLRGIFCFETSDRFDLDECIEENLEFGSDSGENFAGLFGMHASLSLCDRSLEKISKSTGDMPIHIHVAESIEDEEDCYSRYGTSIVKRLNRFGLLKPDSILAHCVHINEDEARLIADNGCYVVMNPTSNMNNAVGLADFDMLRRNNVMRMIGNDGLGANITREYLNLVFAMKNRLQNPAGFKLDELSEMIDCGYGYVGKMLRIKLGRIQKGYKADMVCVPYNPPTPMNSSNVLGHVFFGVFDNFRPRDVWASGNMLLKDYNFTSDIETIYSGARDEAQKVWNRISKIN